MSPQKTTYIIYAVILVGVGLLLLALSFYRSTRSFISEAAKAEGTVVELVKVVSTQTDSRSRSSRSISYHPIVQFVAPGGVGFEFTSSTGSNPSDFSKGQKVEVLYLPQDPQTAQINSFYSLWGDSLFLTVFGGILILIGAGVSYANAQQDCDDAYLQRQGVPIETEFQRVELNTSSSVGSEHPYRVVSQWMNPATSELHIFKSHNVWRNPTPYIQSEKITVLIETGNPQKYYVDLSFIPELDENVP